MAHDPKALRPILEAATPPDAELAMRAMFGGRMARARTRPPSRHWMMIAYQ
ncbi:hypothetical protein PQ455_08830 [Sphingomonas naphthae]|uniref:Uncharacterized protein n=1 Tax=Sphingomonas naphthae TaxID=1813468 RepID=A0ABY7TPY9_9SPHN|nr:hypothetical protein [Sphingomonas naphthae]WCT75304.1 hypothetical protein PQ455_08830 [Sphingomonas naphthae]